MQVEIVLAAVVCNNLVGKWSRKRLPTGAPKVRFAGKTALGALLWSAAASAQGPLHHQLPAAIAYPEGIAYDARARAFYVAGSASGQIVRVDTRTGEARLIGAGLSGQIENTFPGILGLNLDARGRLWMAGGRTGKVYVVDAKTGALIQTITSPDASNGLINDIAFARGKAFFTDTLRPVLWAVNASSSVAATPEPWIDFAGTALEYSQGANLNGITATPDGRTLLTGQMNKGLLFKIETASRKVTQIDLKGETVTGVDGLVLKGRTLYVIRQPEAEIVTIRLASDMLSGVVVARTKIAGLLWPATGAIAGRDLLVVNTQFNKRRTNDPHVPFSVQRVPLVALDGKP